MHKEESTAEELSRLPTVEEFEGVSGQERARRALVLEGICRRVVEDGIHSAASGPERGRLFMPFAALKGYEDLVGEAELEQSSITFQAGRTIVPRLL